MYSSSPSSFDFSALGWDDSFAALFVAHAADGLVPARVVRVDRGRCDTSTASGPVRAASAAVTSLDPARTVCTGDWAALRPEPEPELIALLPRRSAITRASSDRTSHQQVLAANVDTVAIAVSLTAPLNAGRIERLLVLAWDSGARPVLVLTKADVTDDLDAASAALTSLAPGVDIVTTSAVTGSGPDLLSEVVTGTTVLLGPSGAGKSTLANALLGREHMDTNEVRAVDGKGRHTTVHRELLPLPGGGVLIDTPGLRGIGLHDAADGVERVFAEIEAYARDCAFGDCEHRSEPGCAVQEAVVSGMLDVSRLDCYRKLSRESARAADRGNARESSKRSKTKKMTEKTVLSTDTNWITRAETGGDIPAIRKINLAAFDTAEEADLVDALRADPAWIDSLSILSAGPDGAPVGYALLTRCHVDDTPALCLGPCAVLPEYQRTGAGSAAIRAALAAAEQAGEHFVIVLGHPTYYPRFGFTRASEYGIQLSIDVPDEALMALSLGAEPLPSGTVRYAAPFGI